MVYDVIEACDAEGCPLCRVSQRWGRRFMAAILYEEVTDPHTRGRLKRSFGFCRVHAPEAAEAGTTLLGLAIIYRGLLGQIDASLAAATPGPKQGWLSKLGLGRKPGGSSAGATDASGAGRGAGGDAPAGLAPADPCPACLYLAEMEDAALVALAAALPANERLAAGLRRADGGLCLPHLRRTLALDPSPAAFAFLQETTRARLAALEGELDEFIRKYDHRFRREEWGEERDSWQRAIRWVVGGIAQS
jgi:hypothetical protein